MESLRIFFPRIFMMKKKTSPTKQLLYAIMDAMEDAGESTLDFMRGRIDFDSIASNVKGQFPGKGVQQILVRRQVKPPWVQVIFVN